MDEGRDGQEAREKEFTKKSIRAFVVMHIFMVLILVIVSWVYTYVNLPNRIL